jgi:hypothetical protein
MIHIWHVFHRILGDGRKAVQVGAKFLREATESRATYRL